MPCWLRWTVDRLKNDYTPTSILARELIPDPTPDFPISG